MEPNPSGNAGTDTYLDTEQSLQVRDKQEHLLALSAPVFSPKLG